jgi:hypothetical protein
MSAPPTRVFGDLPYLRIVASARHARTAANKTSHFRGAQVRGAQQRGGAGWTASSANPERGAGQ